MKIDFLKKTFIIFLLISSITFACPNVAMIVRAKDGGTESKKYSIANIFTDAKNFVSIGNNVEATIDSQALQDTSSFIYKLLLAIGIVVAIIVGIILGMQLMIASAEDKAKVKEALVAYAISCFVLFGAFGIWKLVTNVLTNIF